MIRAQTGQGGFDGAVLDPLLRPIASLLQPAEIPVNVALILIFLALAAAIAIAPTHHLVPILASAIVMSLAIWIIGQAAGLILTGATTDFNSGLPLVVLAMACWPRPHPATLDLRTPGDDLKRKACSLTPC